MIHEIQYFYNLTINNPRRIEDSCLEDPWPPRCTESTCPHIPHRNTDCSYYILKHHCIYYHSVEIQMILVCLCPRRCEISPLSSCQNSHHHPSTVSQRLQGFNGWCLQWPRRTTWTTSIGYLVILWNSSVEVSFDETSIFVWNFEFFGREISLIWLKISSI